MAQLPSFASLWNNYPNGDPDAVKAMIGGHVNATWITNTCVIRMCYALNHSGYLVHPTGGLHTISGKDGLQYGYRVSEFKRFMEANFGPPEAFNASQQGIICFDVSVWSDATGHFDLWDGQQCRHEGYFNVASAEHIWPC
jgi:hypothetical protein